MRDVAVPLCVVLVIAFDTSAFKMGTVNNVRINILLDVDIFMINLHRCNGMIHFFKK